jgi:hypothetical protein
LARSFRLSAPRAIGSFESKYPSSAQRKIRPNVGRIARTEGSLQLRRLPKTEPLVQIGNDVYATSTRRQQWRGSIFENVHQRRAAG